MSQTTHTHPNVPDASGAIGLMAGAGLAALVFAAAFVVAVATGTGSI